MVGEIEVPTEEDRCRATSPTTWASLRTPSLATLTTKEEHSKVALEVDVLVRVERNAFEV